jgi:hypothetical protein
MLPANPRKTRKSVREDSAGGRLALSFKIRKITIGKGKTVGDGKAGKWVRAYYEFEAELEDEHQIELAKGSMEALLDAWLRGECATPEKPGWDPGKVKWTEEEGFKGKYEKSEDVNNPDFKAMLKDLHEHKGRMSHNGYFYWVFSNGSTVGRKNKTKE